MTRGELLDRMDSYELTEWLAFSLSEHFGERRADERAALVASVIANVNRDPEKKREPFEIADFLLHLDEDERDAIARRQAKRDELAFLEALGAPDDALAELRARDEMT